MEAATMLTDFNSSFCLRSIQRAQDPLLGHFPLRGVAISVSDLDRMRARPDT